MIVRDNTRPIRSKQAQRGRTMASGLERGKGVGVVDLDVASNLAVDDPRAPLGGDGTLHGLEAALRAGERHSGNVNVTGVVEDAHRGGRREEVLNVRDDRADVLGVLDATARAPQRGLQP